MSFLFSSPMDILSLIWDALLLMFPEYPFPFMTVDAEKAAAKTYDYIIVGGGAAGCPLAATLSQHYSVLLLERGDSPYGNPDVENSTGLFKILLEADDYPYVAQRFVTEDGVQLVRARVLGGGTAINGGFYSRASMEFIRKMKWNEKLVNESYEWVERLTAFKPDKLFPWSSSFKDGLLEAGVLPYNGYTLDHVQGTKIGASLFDNKGKRHTAADLLKYANPENIVVLLNSTVSKLLFNLESGKIKATGVELNSDVDGLSYNVLINQLSPRSEVILSAGCIGSPQLLLLSGIGPSQQLKELNITMVLDLPFVGKGIKDPPRATIVLESPKPLPSASAQECIVGVKVMANLTATNSIQEYKFIGLDNSSTFRFLGPALPQNQSNNEHLAKFCRDTLGTAFHFYGGCHIDSVIDKNHRVKSVDNLRVVDNSVFKEGPGTNPQATVMMLGRYIGVRIIRGRMKSLRFPTLSINKGIFTH
ncbi:hypothetical protein KI387_034050, partial [Taxus chinensis]